MPATHGGAIARRGRGGVVRGREDFPHWVVLCVLGPGEPIGMYHWEANQEDFLVLSGEGLLLIEGVERPLRWEFVHRPVGASHIIIGAGVSPCVVLAVGARGNEGDAPWVSIPFELAQRHGVGVETETSDAGKAYARFPTPRVDELPRGLAPGLVPSRS